MKALLAVVPAILIAGLTIPTAQASAVCHRSAPDGICPISDTVYIRNNVFTTEGPQSIWERSGSNWGVISRQPRGNTAVLSYPSRQDLQYLPIRKYKALRASFSVNEPARGDYEAAFDIWVQPNGNPNDWDHNIEIMIWINNHGQTPAGNVVGSATTEFGQRFTVWRDGGKGAGDSTVSLVLKPGAKRGTIHILSVFRWLEAHGYFPARSGLNDVEFGWEICSTGGVTEHFNVNSYRLVRKLR